MTPRGQILLVLRKYVNDLTKSKNSISCVVISRRHTRKTLPRRSMHSSCFSFAASFATTLQIRPFIFNDFQHAPPTTPFLPCICIVAGGWVGPILSGVKLLQFGSSASSRHAAFTPGRCLLFSISYALPNLQLLCFDNLATVPGGVGRTEVAMVNSGHGLTNYGLARRWYRRNAILVNLQGRRE